MLVPHFLTHLARPLRLIDRRIPLVERWIKTPLNDEDERNIRIACAESGKKRLGAFYHWYLQKKFVAEAVRGADRERFLRLMQSADHTDYKQIQGVLNSKSGLLIAIPHHAHYIMSMAMLTEVIREHRQVYLFYGRPETHPGNEIFDELNEWFWGNGSNVAFVHDTRKGLATAMRELKAGAVVFIMPDVFKDANLTISIPFCGRALSVMLGTSIIARKTGATVLPMISTPYGSGLGFKSEFGESFAAHHPVYGEDQSGLIEAFDYSVIRKIFAFYEPIMSRQMLYWQNVRQHVAKGHPFSRLSPSVALQASELLLSDPDMQPPAQIVDLRNDAN
ncbi:MAG: hypothetical protein DI597_16775 [Pseudoxanthomonas spadix]|nr:MAG: hypothetical protein DI597_16775 [Pseudoxanthomonas spadix]